MEGGQADDDFTIPEFIWDIEHVPDYEKRMESYSEEKKKFFRDIFPKVDLLKRLMAENEGWEVLVDDQEAQIKIETKTSERGNVMMRAQGPIDYPPMDVARLYNYGPLQREFDLNEDWTKILEKVGPNMYVMHKKTVKKLVVSARDFIVHALYYKEADGTMYITSSSDNVTTQVEHIDGAVRGEQPLGGFHLKVYPDDPNKTYCVIIKEVNLNGYVPNWVLKQAFKDQGYIIDRLRKTMPKWKTLFPGDRP